MSLIPLSETDQKIKDLEDELMRKDAENAELKREIKNLKRRIAKYSKKE